VTFLSEISVRLAANVAGLTAGTNLWRSISPNDPDASVSLFEYDGGLAPVLGLGETGGVKWENVSLRVEVRGAPRDYTTPRATAELIYNDLAKVQGSTLSSTIYHIIQPLQSPFLLEVDKKERPIFAINFRCEKERS